MANTFQYPAVVSRTLDPANKSLRTLVAMHDRQITDADINEIQDLQDLKLHNILNDMVASGCLTYAPMQFNPFIANTFVIPSFDVLFNGTVVSIAGNQSPDLTVNVVTIPSPSVWGSATNGEDASLYVIFLEIWYQSLNPVTGQGYYINPLQPNLRYYYPYGGVQPDPSNATVSPDDSIDPFEGLLTTQRAQIQWRINVQPVSLNYNFSQFKFGLDPDTVDTSAFGVPLSVYSQASQSSPLNFTGSTYQFTNLGPITGDSGLWVSPPPGSPQAGNINNSLGTMDGYSYAMPLVVVFQRNYGNFDLTNNLFGCANSAVSVSSGVNGLLSSRVSGRFDSKLADQIFADDAVDTRSIVHLQGTDFDTSMRNGFGDLITGNTRLVLARGDDSHNGNKAEAFGSTLSYNVGMSPFSTGQLLALPWVETVGTWDGFANGFSSDERTFYSTVQISTSEKVTGTSFTSWSLNDAFVIALPTGSLGSITEVEVTVLVNNNQNGAKVPVSLLQGQIQFSQLPSTSVTVTFVKNISGTAFDPGSNNLYVTLGVTYPAGGIGLRKVPFALEGGTLFDYTTGRNLPVFGVSDYLPSINVQPLEASTLVVTNPEFSDLTFGTNIWIAIPGSAATQQTVNGISSATFIIPCKGLNNGVNGLYCTQAWDSVTGVNYSISNRIMYALSPAQGNQTVVTLAAAVPTSSTVIFSILAQNTAQLSYNAPVKGVTQVEETVLFGNYTTNSSYPCDPRIVIESVSFNSVPNTYTIVLGANGCQIKGISGDGVNRFIFIADNSGINLNAVQILSTDFGSGTVTITVPGTIPLTGPGAQSFLFCGSILPAFSPQSSLIVSLQYIPYQGEGVLNRDYEILHSEDNALLTTNGTGSAPVIGLQDIYPYNRELPIITMLPAQPSWVTADSELTNTPLATFFDSNYVAMRANNVEHTFLAPLHTNDFIPPINKDTRKTVRFIAAGGRGFTQATPHLGFAIAPPTPLTVLGQNLQSTQAPITLYVDNVSGSDTNSGLDAQDAKQTFLAALSLIPPVLRHPCVIIFNDTGSSYVFNTIQSSLQVIALGDGDIRSAKQYALGNLSRTIQNEGRLVISQAPAATNPVIIDATGFAGFGDGPTSAFYMDTSRVLLNGLQFVGFQNPAITAYNSDIDMVGCTWVGNVQAGAYIGCDSVILDGGATTLPDNGTGHVLTQSDLTSSSHGLTAISTNPGIFYVGTRNSTLNLQTHGIGSLEETSIVNTTVVAEAQLNSNIVVTSDFQTSGAVVLQANSVLLQTPVTTPFLGGVTNDTSSSVVTQV